jgi:hypothetical protein
MIIKTKYTLLSITYHISKYIFYFNKMSKKKSRAYVKESSIPTYGKGLFASDDIKKGLIIAEFRGKLREPDEKHSQNRSNIFFNDNKILDCFPDDIASYANDAVNFTKKRRKIMESLKANEPFYAKHKKTKVNAAIKLYENVHRAVLIAECDIKKNEEIFCHYGFMYWFKTEALTVGFEEEKEFEESGIVIKNIFKYPAFMKYIHEFYDSVLKVEFRPYNDEITDVIIHHKTGGFSLFPIENVITFGRRRITL